MTKIEGSNSNYPQPQLNNQDSVQKEESQKNKPLWEAIDTDEDGLFTAKDSIYKDISETIDKTLSAFKEKIAKNSAFGVLLEVENKCSTYRDALEDYLGKSIRKNAEAIKSLWIKSLALLSDVVLERFNSLDPTKEEFFEETFNKKYLETEND